MLLFLSVIFFLSCSEIEFELNKLSIDFTRYKDRWDKLSRNIDTVSKSVKELHTTSEKISKRFDNINRVDVSSISNNIIDDDEDILELEEDSTEE